jgi:transcriptional regulator GlxA family with amidase domain
MTQQNVGILIFDDVEVLDFAGPFEVFSRTRLKPGVESRRSDQSAPFNVYTVAQTAEPVNAIGNLQIIPHYDFEAAPGIEILVIPGGFGTRRLIDDSATIGWIQGVASGAGLVTSVCTGALLLARAHLLANKRATTHWAALDTLAKIDSTIIVERSARVVEDGVITSGGVAAGIDMAFTVVERLHGNAVAEETAKYIEYSRNS